MKILVTGPNGFIGNNLMRKLKIDEYNIVPFEGDFFNSENIKRQVIKGVEYVLHYVGVGVPGDGKKRYEKELLYEKYSNELFLRCAEIGVRKVIFPSSGGTVYGHVEEFPIREENEIYEVEGKSIHTRVKINLEKNLKTLFQQQGINYTVLRIGNVYGEGQCLYKNFGVINSFIEKFRKHEAIEVYGDGNVIRDFVYIDDVVEANRLSLRHMNEQVFNIGSGQGISINNLIEEIEEILHIGIVRVYTKERENEIKKVILDVTRARNVLGWVPRIDLETGIRYTWGWITGAYLCE